jgi:hypothetical protein
VLLATRASMLGVPAPRYNASGLLCAIDGQPASGCGSEHDGKYSYWSYWHGTGGAWSYASIGPASSRVDADVVEGWRWEPNGSATPNDPPPRARADASTICTSTPATTSAPVTVPTVRANVATTLGVAATSVSRTPTPTNGVVPHATTAAPAKVDATTPAIARATSTSQPSALAGGVPISHAKPDDGSGAPIGLIVGVALVAALAGAGLFIARRRAPTT